MATDITEQWFTQLIEDCKDIIIETGFTSRWALVEGYHQLGTRILAENENFERAKIYGQEIVSHVSISLGKQPRTVYRAIQFAKLYPDLNLLPEGKNCNWHRIVNKYLTDGKERVTISKGDLIKMIKEIKQLLQTEWMKENQEVATGNIAIAKSNCDFIRYLQDQVNKIVGEIGGQ